MHNGVGKHLTAFRSGASSLLECFQNQGRTISKHIPSPKLLKALRGNGYLSFLDFVKFVASTITKLDYKIFSFKPCAIVSL